MLQSFIIFTLTLLQIFWIREKNQSSSEYAIRMYAGEFKVGQPQTPIKKKPYLLMNLPYYLGSKIHEYIEPKILS